MTTTAKKTTTKKDPLELPLKPFAFEVLHLLSKQRSKARDELLKNLNPIIKNYMQEKKIRMVVDKKSLLLADENLNITKDIMNLLNKKLKSIFLIKTKS